MAAENKGNANYNWNETYGLLLNEKWINNLTK